MGGPWLLGPSPWLLCSSSSLPYLTWSSWRGRRTLAASLLLPHADPGCAGSALPTRWPPSSRTRATNKYHNDRKHCEGKILASSAHGCARSLTHSCWSVFLLLLFHVYVCVGVGCRMCEIQTHVCAHTCGGQKLILGTILHRCSPACWLTGHRGRCSVGPAGQHAVGILVPCVLHPHPVPHGPGLTGAAMPEQHLS